jgi:hypothetical protein
VAEEDYLMPIIFEGAIDVRNQFNSAVVVCIVHCASGHSSVKRVVATMNKISVECLAVGGHSSGKKKHDKDENAHP